MALDAQVKRSAPSTRDSTCPVCGAAAQPAPEIGAGLYFRCPRCGLHFCDAHGVPHDLFTQAYRGKVADASMDEFQFRARYLAPLQHTDFLASPPIRLSLRWLVRHAAPRSTVLDVGCGWGMMLRALRARGFRAVGLDVAQPVAEILSWQGFRVHVGPVESYPPSLPEPDYVTCNFVLHHIADPVAFLRNVAERFPRAPLLIVEGLYPNWMSGQIPQPAIAYPRDLTVWNSRALSTALARAGCLRHELRHPPPSPGDVQLPLGQWGGRVTAMLNGHAPRPEPADMAPVPGLRLAIRTVLLLKRVVFGGQAWYARRRRLPPASVLAIAYPAEVSPSRLPRPGLVPQRGVDGVK